jgi:hypothetical protein
MRRSLDEALSLLVDLYRLYTEAPEGMNLILIQADCRFHGRRPISRARHSLARPYGQLSNDAAGFASCYGPHRRSPIQGF